MATLNNFGADVTNSLATVYTCPAGKTCMLFQVRAANTHASDQAEFDAVIGYGGGDQYIDKNIPVPYGSHYDAVVSTDKFILKENETFKVKADANGVLEVSGSVVEI